MDAVGICNAALELLGVDQIQALDEESSPAELCNAHFVPTRDAVLGEGVWRFAIQRHELAADAEAPAYGYAHRYQLPTVIQILEANDGEYPLEAWEREGRYLLTDQAGPIYIRSVDQVDDVSLWPPGFSQAVITRLAATFAPVLSENRSLAADLWQLYLRQLKEALLADGQQATPRSYLGGALAQVRGWRT